MPGMAKTVLNNHVLVISLIRIGLQRYIFDNMTNFFELGFSSKEMFYSILLVLPLLSAGFFQVIVERKAFHLLRF